MTDAVKQLTVTDNFVTIGDGTGRALLEDCFGSIQLTSGAQFSMHAMKRVSHVRDTGIVVEAGGNDVLPKMRWQADVLGSSQVRVSLSITNTTQVPMSIERIDVLICREGYQSIDPRELLVRRTGWQMSSPAALLTPLLSDDPWLLPPLHAPMTLPSSAVEQHLPWMTILQTETTDPLLIGFGGAKDYLGVINIQSNAVGHRIVASNYLEGIILAPGETFQSEPLLVAWNKTEPALLEEYGDYLHDAMSARIPDHVPTGWSHWLYYFASVTEKDILENLDIITQKNLPFEYVQIDDGFQTYFGDWLSINDKFPHGMKYLADTIKKAGRKPGIWLSPFMADARSEVVTQHPDWFLHDYNGYLLNVNRHGDPYWPAPNYGLDLTHPEAFEWLRNILVVMCEEWGYEYLKIDFLYAGAIRAKRYDQNVTSVQAYRRGMELIREIAGERLILGCGAPLLCSIGLVDDMRIGPDLSWEFDTAPGERPADYTLSTTREPLLSLFSHQWMNKKLWINDADYVRTRQHKISLGWEETVALTSLIALGGGALYDSDKLATLEPAGYDLLNRLFPVADISATTVGREIGKPSRMSAGITKGDGSWTIVARFNWNTEPQPDAFDAAQWKLAAGKYHIYDLTGETYLGLHAACALSDIHAKGVGLYSVCKQVDHPQVVATKGHLLGPAGDIESVSWKDNVLNIKLHEGRRTNTELLVHVPLGYELLTHDDCEITGKTRVIYTVRPRIKSCVLTFK